MLSRFLLFIFATGFLGFGLVYLSNPQKILQFHNALKEFILNDAYISLHRRKIGSIFILIGVVLLAVAWRG